MIEERSEIQITNEMKHKSTEITKLSQKLSMNCSKNENKKRPSKYYLELQFDQTLSDQIEFNY